MMKISFRGDPFVDAGIAGMCAAAEVESAAQLDAPAIERAVETLIKFMLSEAAFKPRQIEGKPKPTAFATSEMTVIFTKNGVLSQSSFTAPKRKQVYTSRLYAKRDGVMQILRGEATPSAKRCFIDGQPACFDVGNDEFPLVDSRSKRNFHPSLGEGHPVGALTALALEFFPFAVLRTGVNSGNFWFVHTAHEPIAIACAKLTVDCMNDAMAKNDGFGFFGDWGIGNRSSDTALVALIRDIASRKVRQALTVEEIDKSGFPVTAYEFSNDSRKPEIKSHDLPHALFDFFFVLKSRGEAMKRFNREILAYERKGAFLVPRTMLRREPIVRLCLVKPIKEFSGALRGSWEAHAIYAKEVLEMSSHFIRDVERIAARVMDADNSKDLLFSLESMRGRDALMRLARKNVLDENEFARLVPDEPFAADKACAYLLGAIYEMKRARADGREFVAWDGDEEAPPPLSEAVQLAQDIGTAIIADENVKRLTFQIAHATKINSLRGVMVNAAYRGLMNWSQFIAMFPPEKPFHAFLIRDYLLVFLYSAQRDHLEEMPEPETPDARELAAFEAEISVA